MLVHCVCHVAHIVWRWRAVQLIDWLIGDWLIDWFIGWLIDWLIVLSSKAGTKAATISSMLPDPRWPRSFSQQLSQAWGYFKLISCHVKPISCHVGLLQPAFAQVSCRLRRSKHCQSNCNPFTKASISSVPQYPSQNPSCPRSSISGHNFILNNPRPFEDISFAWVCELFEQQHN